MVTGCKTIKLMIPEIATGYDVILIINSLLTILTPVRNRLLTMMR